LPAFGAAANSAAVNSLTVPLWVSTRPHTAGVLLVPHWTPTIVMPFVVSPMAST
jgi:hypothetical protein